MKRVFYLITLFILTLVSCSKDTAPIEPQEEDAFVECREVTGSYSEKRANPLTGMIEGDIFPDKVQDSTSKAYINASADSRLWIDNTIPFYLDETLSDDKKNQILSTITHIEENTNLYFIEFEDRSTLLISYQDGLRITAPLNPFAGNGSHVGRQGGIQNLTLTESSSDYVIEHEIFHTANHEHEHNRPDRDEYLTVHWENIPINPFLRRQFEKGSESDTCVIGYKEYDFTSGMHYGSFNGSTSPDKPAITKKNGDTIPVPTRMSEMDYAGNRALYVKLK